MKKTLIILIVLLCLIGIISTVLYILSPPTAIKSEQSFETPLGNIPLGETFNLSNNYLLYVETVHGNILNNVKLTDKNTTRIIYADSAEFISSPKKDKCYLRLTNVLLKMADGTENRIAEFSMPFVIR